MTKIILMSAYVPIEELKKILPPDTQWYYSGKDLNRYQLFKKNLELQIKPACHPRDFHEFTEKLRLPFIRWKESMDNIQGGSVDYWANTLFSRDPYQSDLFFNISQVLWIKKFLFASRQGSILIILESAGILYALRSILKNKGAEYKTCGVRYAWGQLICQSTQVVLGFLKNAGLFFLRCIIARLNKGDIPNIVNNKLIIIGTYLISKNLKDNSFYQDPFFPGLNDWLKLKGWEIMVCPFLNSAWIKDNIAALKKMPKNFCKFILLENHIKFSDLIHALLFPIRQIARFIILGSKLKTIKLGDEYEEIPSVMLMVELAWKSCFNWISAEGLLHYIFPLRLRQAGIKPKSYIIWYENQIMQKSSVGGFKKYLPDTEIVGAQMFIPPRNHLNLFITESENNFNMAPDRIMVSGGFFSEIFTCYQRSIPVENGPPLRYQYLWELNQKMEKECGNKINDDKCKTCLVILPQSFAHSEDLLIKIMPALTEAKKNGRGVMIKTHPTVSISQILSIIEKMGPVISVNDFTNKTLHEILSNISAVISTGSGAILEVLCLGIPVVMVGPSTGLEMFPYLPPDAASLCRVAYIVDEVRHELIEWALRYPGSKLQRIKVGKKILMECFNRQNDKTMEVFLPNNMREN